MKAAISDWFHPIAFSTKVPSTSSQIAVLSLLSLWRTRSFSEAVPGGGFSRTLEAGIFPNRFSNCATFSGLPRAMAEVRADAVAMTGILTEFQNRARARSARSFLQTAPSSPPIMKLPRERTAGKLHCASMRSFQPSASLRVANTFVAIGNGPLTTDITKK